MPTNHGAHPRRSAESLPAWVAAALKNARTARVELVSVLACLNAQKRRPTTSSSFRCCTNSRAQ